MAFSISNLFGHIRNQHTGPAPSTAPRNASTQNEECVAAPDITALSWLQTTKATEATISQPFDLRMFGLECADAFISGTDVLEGENFSNTLQRFKGNYKKALEEMKRVTGKTLNVDLSHLDQCQQEAVKLNGITNNSGIRTHADTLLTHIKSLGPNKSFWFPGGWAGSPSGHAMIYHIKKQPNGKYSFTLYNTGAGVSYHHHIIADNHDKYQTHLSIKDIESDKIEQKEFFLSLIEPQVLPTIDATVECGPENVYLGALEYLGGKIEDAIDYEKHPEHYMKPQRAGTCAMKVIYAALRHTVLDAEGKLNSYKQLKFFYKRQSLIDMCLIYFNDENLNYRTINKQLSQVTSSLARTARKLFKGGLLSAETLKECEATILDIQQRIKNKKERSKAEEDKIGLSFDINQEGSELKSSSGCQYSPYIYKGSNSNKSGLLSSISLPKRSEIKTETVSSIIKNTLYGINAHIEKPNASPLQSLDAFVSLMRLLPIPTQNDQDFWNKIPENDIENTLKYLQKLTQFAFREGTPKPIVPETLIALYTALAISDKLARRNKDNCLDGYNTSYFQLIALIQSPHIQLRSPRDHTRIKELLNYWVPDFNSNERVSGNDLGKGSYDSLFVHNWGTTGMRSSKNDLDQKQFKFYKQLVARDDIRDKINKSSLNGKPLHEIIGGLIEEKMGSNTILPMQIHCLRQISISCSLAAAGANPQSKYKNFEFYYKKDKRSSSTTNVVPDTIFKLSLLNLDSNKKSDKTYHSFYNGISAKDGERESFEPLLCLKYMNPLKGSEGEFKKFSCHFEGKTQNEIMKGYILEEDRDVRLIDTSVADEVTRTLAYYTARPNSLFTDPTHQFILESHLLRPERLQAALKEEPRLATKLFKFINERIDYFNSANQWKVALYFAELGHNCCNQTQYLIGDASDKGSRNYRDVILNEILPKRKNASERAEIFLTLGNLHSATDTDDFHSNKIGISKDILLSLILLPIATIQDPNLIKTNSYIHEQHRIAQTRHLANIIKLLNEDSSARNEILSYVMSGIKNQNLSTEWEGADLLFQTKDRKYSIDLSKGKASEDGKPFAGIPAGVIKHETFKKLFKNITAIRADPTDGLKFEIDHDNITSTLVHSSQISSISNKFELRITRSIGGIKHQYIPSKELHEELSTIIDMDEELSTDMPFAFIDPQDKTTSIWYDKNQKSYIVESDDGKTYTINSTYSRGEYRIDIETSSDFVIGKNKNLVNPWKTDKLRHLGNFEQRKYIGCWKYAGEDHISEINMARLGLSFQVRGGIAYSKELPGYHIDENQNIEFKGRGANYLCVINNEGKRRVIIPKDIYKVKVDKQIEAYDPQLLPQSEERKLDFMVFDIIETDGIKRLKATSVNDNLFLIYMLATKKQYKQALYYLSQSQSLSLYSSNDLKIIDAILASEDGHPSATLLRLKLLAITEENRLKYASESKDFFDKKLWETIAGKTLPNYLNNLHNTTLDKLSLEEEKSLLRMLNARNLIVVPVVLQRLSAIMNQNRQQTTKQVPKDRRVLPPSKKLSSIEEQTLIDLLAQPQEKDFTRDPLSIAGLSRQDFHKYLPSLYKVARDGSYSDKKKLQNILTLMEGSSLMLDENNGDLVALSCLIRAVIEKPSEFPTVAELKSLQAYDRLYGYGEKYSKWLEERKTAYDKLITHGSNSSREGNPIDLIEKLRAAMAFNNLSPKKHDIDTLLFGLPEIQGLDDNTSTAMPLDSNLKQIDENWDDFFKKYSTNKDAREMLIESIALRNEINHEKDLIKQRIILIESTINSFPKEIHVDEHLKVLGKEKRKLSFQDAIDLFEEGKMARYKQFSHLSEAQIKDLDGTIGAVLIQITRVAQAEQLLEILNLLQDQTIDEDEDNALTKKRDELINTRRAHFTNGKGKRSRSYLVFEARNKIILREKQIDNLDSFIDHKDPMQLLEVLGTGSGKSKILAPMKQWLRRGKNGLIFNLWPSALYEVNRDDIKEQIGDSYRTHSDTFEFDRATDTSLLNLIFMNRELRKVVNEMRQLSAKPESTQSCELKLLEVLHKIAFEKITFPEKTLSSLQEILKLMLDAEAHVDEGHKNFSPRREVNFTIGDPKIESTKHVLLIEKIYDLIITDKELINIVRLESNQQHLMSEEDFTKIVAPKIAEKLSSYLGIKDDQKKEFLEYVVGKTTSLPSWIESHERKQEISLLRGELVFILPQTLSRCTGVHYGLSKERPSIEYAKPYDANDSCVERAEYDNVHEAFNKTYQTYIHSRLSVDQQWKLISYLQTEALKEEKRTSKDKKETEAYKFFQNNFPKGIPDLFALDKALLEPWVNGINKNNTIIFYYIRTLITPTIKKYKFKLKSDSQNFRSQFKNVMTMTATPGSRDAYGPKMGTREDPGNDALIMDNLELKCSAPGSVQVIKQTEPKKIIEDIANTLKADTDARMLIDIGALFKGISNREVAQIIFKRFRDLKSNVKGVIFFENNKLVIMEGENLVIPLEQSQLKPKDRFSYCDNKHMFGADIKQSPTARGLCTFDTTIDLDDMVQGVGRLREFLKGQTVSWILTEESAKVLKPNYGKNHKISFNTLKKQAESNLELRKADDNHRSLKQQMRNEIRVICIKKIVHAKSDKEAIDLFKKFYSVLVDEVCSEPFLLYGQIEKIVTGHQSLLNYQQKLLEKLETMEGFDSKEKESIKTNLNGYKKKIDSLKDHLPKEVKEFNAELGTESEVQQNVDSDVETTQETMTSDLEGLYNRKVTPWPTRFDMYKGVWFKPVATSLLLHDLFIKLKPMFLFCVNNAFRPTIKVFNYLIDTKSPARIRQVVKLIVFVGPVAVINVIAVAILAIPVLVIFGTTYVVIKLGRLCQTAVGRLFARRNKYGYSNTPIPIYSVSDVVKMNPDPEVTKASGLFKDLSTQQLRMTNNFVTLKPLGSTDPSVKPLGKEQKSINEILVIEDTLSNGRKSLTFVVGDQSTDATFWRKELAQDRLTTTDKELSTRKRKICLYDMRLGIVSDSKNRFNEEELVKNSEFQQMLIKLKLFNGDVDYTEEQEKILKMWSEDKDKKKIIKDFFNKALAWHDLKKKNFKDSIIHKLFNE